MKCPHCATEIHLTINQAFTHPYDKSHFPSKINATGFDIVHGFCPSCSGMIVLLRQGPFEGAGLGGLKEIVHEQLLFPHSVFRPVEQEVPQQYAQDFREAASVLCISPKASAAIGRRLLQHLLREHFGIKKRDLADEIDEFINRKDVPNYLTEAVDAVRNIGNFAAHPLKNTNTGEVTDVETGEAEWIIEVLESLFDFAFVQPERLKLRKQQLNNKLQALGKPTMKST